VTPGRVAGQGRRVDGAAAPTATRAAAAEGGDMKDGTLLMDRVRSCRQDVPLGEGDERIRNVLIRRDRLARDHAAGRERRTAWHGVSVRGRDDPVPQQVLGVPDRGHLGGTIHLQVGDDHGIDSVDSRSVSGNAAADCLVTVPPGAGASRLGTGLDRAWQDVVRADAPGGVGPGVGGNGDCVAPVRGWPGGCRGRDGAGRGDEQPTARRRDGHGGGGQRLPQT